MAKTLIRITTVPMAFKALLAGQPKFMKAHGFNVILISADGKEIEDVKAAENCEYIIVPLTRKITPRQDVVCFFKLRKIFKKYKPDIVHTHTPKAGLLGMLAAKSAGVKIRIHTVAGLPVMLQKGFKRSILFLTEKLTYSAATNIWPNSASMQNFILEKKLVDAQKLSIINNGSSNGIDLQKFSTSNLDISKKNKIKTLLPESNTIKILCVGRMVKDKGIEELINVFEKLLSQHKLHLILIGPFEHELDALSNHTLAAIKNNPGITHINWSDDIEYFMSCADILIHPSHREGFSNVILQAGAMQLPVICSNIPGNIDIIQNEKTGLLFEVKDENDLFAKIEFALNHPEKIKEYSLTLFKEITELYDRKKIHEAILANYNLLLKNHGIK